MSRDRLLRIGALAAILSAAPVAFSPEKGLVVQAACGQYERAGDGPCCAAANNICISNGARVNNAYLKPWYDFGACG